MSMFRSVCWDRKCSQQATLGGMTKSQPSILHIRSAKTVLLSSLRTDNTAIVPGGP